MKTGAGGYGSRGYTYDLVGNRTAETTTRLTPLRWR